MFMVVQKRLALIINKKCCLAIKAKIFRIYAKVIIEVNDLQNNDLIGKLVLSKAGRDRNHLYVVIAKLNEEYVLLSNGSTKNVDKPKKKKVKHLTFYDIINDEVKEAIINKDKSTDLKIKRFLKKEGIVKEG